MDSTVAHIVEVKVAEIALGPVDEPSISTLTSTEMSFAGGGLLAVAFG